MFNDLPKNEQEVLLQYPNYSDEFRRIHYNELESLVNKGILTKQPNTSAWKPSIYTITQFGENLLNNR